MSQPKLPLKVRYTRGKFRHLASPLFWFPLGIISLLVVFIWQISINPELLQTETDQLPTEGSDVEEKEMSEAELNAIAADIDSSQFLLKELETNTPPANLPVVPRKAVLDDYIDENGKSLTLLEKTQQELSDIYGQMGKEKTTENLLGENVDNNSILNWRTNQEINHYSPQESNNNFSNPQPLFSPNFNSLNSEKRDEKGLMQHDLDSGDSSESREKNYRNSNNYNSQLYQNQEDLRTDNYQVPGSLPNNPNYSNPEINSGYQPYYLNGSGDNSRQQERPYYTNSYGSSTVETPENQPYYSDRYGNYSTPTQPAEINVPSIVPIVPNNSNLPNNNPYSRMGYPYSGNNPYSVNQEAQQQNQLNNGANYYQQNNGATQQPQPYNNFQSNPFNNQRFGEQNNPFSNNR